MESNGIENRDKRVSNPSRERESLKRNYWLSFVQLTRLLSRPLARLPLMSLRLLFVSFCFCAFQAGLFAESWRRPIYVAAALEPAPSQAQAQLLRGSLAKPEVETAAAATIFQLLVCPTSAA